MADLDCTVDLGRGLRLRTPVLTASGTFAYGFDAPLVDRGALGAIVTKGTTLRPRSGNSPARIAETPSGMLNAIGLQNPGVDAVRREYAPRWAAWDLPVIVNVAGDRLEDYVEVVRRLDGVPGVSGIELNVSCPNVAAGMQFGVDARLAAQLTAAVRAATSLHLMVKLTPNVTELVPIARAVADAGADSVSAVNTYVGMAIDLRRRRPVLANEVGGLSGPAIKPLALHAVWEVVPAVSIPVVGMGGISGPQDALEFLLAGAAAVQLGTVNYVNPNAAREVLDGIRGYALERGWSDLRPFPLRASPVPSHA
ncbi:MAG: dihydroorotate dehydrogenase [Chloroflexi bacterium]|nr:MAG: dihydroorotate dehydrogenase [Chloroflexota bacterium]